MIGDVNAGPQTVTIIVKVEEPVFLTLQAGKADNYESEISDLRVELFNVQRQLRDSHAQLADNGGVLRVAQEQLADSHDALSIERQKTMDLMREMTAISQLPLPSAVSGDTTTATASSDKEEVSQSRGSGTEAPGIGTEGLGMANRAVLAIARSGFDKAAALGQVRACPNATSLLTLVSCGYTYDICLIPSCTT